MGDMGDTFRAMTAHTKKIRAKRNNRFEPLLIQAGATFKASGIYELDGWFCYPTKGFAMNKFNTSERRSLKEFLSIYDKRLTQEQIEKMKHMIGFTSYSKITNHNGVRIYDAYRNYYCAGVESIACLDELVKQGLADRWTSHYDGKTIYYSLTGEGLTCIGKILGLVVKERE